jgi:hypothetical protein
LAKTSRSARLIIVALVAAAATLFAVDGFAQAPSPAAPGGTALSPTIDGSIAAIGASRVTLTLADGTQRTVKLQASTMILQRQVATLDSIREGDALGVAARRADNALVATNINIFSPQMWDVVRRGQFPMASGDLMTNAVVEKSAKAIQGRVLTMKLSEGIAAITVPEGVPIHRLVTLSASSLAAGLHVVIRGTENADGTFTAASVSFDQPPKG